jgi:hypothetical protein
MSHPHAKLKWEQVAMWLFLTAATIISVLSGYLLWTKASVR